MDESGGTIRGSEEKYRDLFDNVNDGFAAIDTAGNITYFNERFTDMAGYPAEELVGKNIADLIRPEDQKRVLKWHKKRQGSIIISATSIQIWKGR